MKGFSGVRVCGSGLVAFEAPNSEKYGDAGKSPPCCSSQEVP